MGANREGRKAGVYMVSASSRNGSRRLAYAPAWPLGIPTDWDLDFDDDDPPMYESQPSYFKRHELLAPGELKRLTKKDFEAEAAVDLLHEYEDDEAEA